MNINYSDDVRRWAEIFPLVQKATNRLEEILGSSAGMVSGEWDRIQDEKGRDLLTLRLKDFTGEAVGRFVPDELRSASQTSFRLRRLWGDLLLIGSHKQLEKLTGSGG
jgi:hypothetical protein